MPNWQILEFMNIKKYLLSNREILMNMVNYICNRCEKVFSDKTKYSLHISRKNPCKKTVSASFHVVDDLSDKEEISNHADKDGFSNYCRLCKINYRSENETSTSLIHHLLDKHDIQKVEKTFRFSKKTSGLSIFENEKDAGDVVIIGLPSDKSILFTTTNLHNLQRHKRDKYRNMTSWTYYPCKNIPFFKMEWNHFIKSNVEENDQEYPIDWLESEVSRLLIKVNQQDRVEKNVCLFKESHYYQCPYCDQSVDDLEQMQIHLHSKHRFLKHDSSKLELNPEQEHQLVTVMSDHHIKSITEEFDYICKYCQMEFSSSFLLQKHMKEVCRKSAFGRKEEMIESGDLNITPNLDDLMEYNERLRTENAMLKEALISNQEMIKDSNEILKNSMSYVKTTNIIQNNNIMFNVNDFGQEDLSHIQGEFVEEVIQEMSTNSLIKFIEEVHYGNPRNCNVIIPPNQKDQQNTKLLLKKGDRWVMDDRKNVLDDMITINIERITDVYDEINVKLTEEVQTNFQNYVSGADTKMIRDEAISETESLIKRRQPTNKFLLENARVQQNQFIGGQWNKSIDTQFPAIKMDVGGMSDVQIQNIMDGPPTQIRETPPILQKMKSMRNKKT